IDVRDTKGDLKVVEAAARRLEEQKVDLIYTVGTSVSVAAKRATSAAPIVFYAGTDPVALGLVRSFRQPRRTTHGHPRAVHGPHGEAPGAPEGDDSDTSSSRDVLQPGQPRCSAVPDYRA